MGQCWLAVWVLIHFNMQCKWNMWLHLPHTAQIIEMIIWDFFLYHWILKGRFNLGDSHRLVSYNLRNMYQRASCKCHNCPLSRPTSIQPLHATCTAQMEDEENVHSKREASKLFYCEFHGCFAALISTCVQDLNVLHFFQQSHWSQSSWSQEHKGRQNNKNWKKNRARWGSNPQSLD